GVTATELPSATEVVTQVDVPRLDHAKPIVPVHTEAVGGRRVVEGRDRVGERERSGKRPDARARRRKRRLCDQLPCDGGIRAIVEARAESCANDSARGRSPCDADSWGKVIVIAIDETRRERSGVETRAAGDDRIDRGEPRRDVEI